MNQHRASQQEVRAYGAPFGVKVAKVGVKPRPEHSSTGESQAVARAVVGAGAEATVQLVVMLRTLMDAVAHGTLVQAHVRAAATVKALARGQVAALLVLPTWTVHDSVAAHVDRKTVAVTRTPEVGAWTGQSLVADPEPVGDGVNAKHDTATEAAGFIEADDGG